MWTKHLQMWLLANNTVELFGDCCASNLSGRRKKGAEPLFQESGEKEARKVSAHAHAHERLETEWRMDDSGVAQGRVLVAER